MLILLLTINSKLQNKMLSVKDWTRVGFLVVITNMIISFLTPHFYIAHNSQLIMQQENNKKTKDYILRLITAAKGVTIS